MDDEEVQKLAAEIARICWKRFEAKYRAMEARALDAEALVESLSSARGDMRAVIRGLASDASKKEYARQMEAA